MAPRGGAGLNTTMQGYKAIGIAQRGRSFCRGGNLFPLALTVTDNFCI